MKYVFNNFFDSAWMKISIALLVLISISIFSLTQGYANIHLGTIAEIFLQMIVTNDQSPISEASRLIITEIRLPRLVAAIVVGAALAYSGATYQGIFRNPLADPFLLGIASGASLGIALLIISPWQQNLYVGILSPIVAFFSSGITIVVVLLLARKAGKFDNYSIILAGVALSAIFSAFTSFILLTGGENARPIFGFLFGGFNTITWLKVILCTPYILVGSTIIFFFGHRLNLLQLDDDQAQNLGLNVENTRMILLAAASLIAAAAVAMAGIIGFVGLIVPHMIRLIVGSDYRLLLPLAAIFGSTFVVITDVIARTVINPQEIPVGIVTAMVGGPFFIWLLLSQKRISM
tara:strand:+ start:4351 stop:5397 length:1047 start_codon:yes stop_codon:yes gene_type:complete